MVVESKRINILIPCACGKCSLQIFKFDEHNGWIERKYARGHALKGKPHSDEHKLNITKAKIGHEVSEETREKLRKAFKGKPISKEFLHKWNRKGNKNNGWKGGKYIDSDGYWRVWTVNGYILEHRYIIEQQLGRKLTNAEVVHHINEIKTDNRIENLQVMTRIEHNRIHFKNKKIGLVLNFLEIIGFED